jgi:F-type H+-transporting ATPase subunit a
VPKRGCLGFSLPMLIGLTVFILGLLIVGFIIGPLGQKMLGDIGLPEWLSVAKPQPELPAETVFHISGFAVTNAMIATWVTILFLVGFSYAVTRRMRLIPTRLQSAFESLLGWLYDLCCSVAGDKNGRRFFPIVATIFLMVGFNAWLGLIPGYGSITVKTAEGAVNVLRPANTDINTPLALALVSFVFVEVTALRSIGFGYVKKFINVSEFWHSVRRVFKGKVKDGLFGLFTGAINIFTGFLEGLSEFIRIISLTFRLFGNMTAGEILVFVMLFLISLLSILVLPLYGLELLIGFIQAIIFGGLTLIFLTVAVQSHGEEAH